MLIQCCTKWKNLQVFSVVFRAWEGIQKPPPCGLTRGGVSADPVKGLVMLSAAKHLVCRALHTSPPQMLRCAQHDRRDGVAPGKKPPRVSLRVASGLLPGLSRKSLDSEAAHVSGYG